MTNEAKTPKRRYAQVNGELLNHIQTRLGISDEELAGEVGLRAYKNRNMIDPKRVASWINGDVDRETYSNLLATLAVLVNEFRKKWGLREADFPTPLSLNRHELELAGSGRLINRIDAVLQVSSRLFTPPDEAGHVGLEMSVAHMYDFIAGAALKGGPPVPFYAAISSGEYAITILDMIAKVTAETRAAPPLSKVVFRVVKPATLSTLTKLGVADRKWATFLKLNMEKVAAMRFSRKGPLKPSVTYWPGLPPLFAWLCGDRLAYSRCDIGDDGRLRTSFGLKCIALDEQLHPEEFQRIATLVMTGKPLRFRGSGK